MQSVRIAVSSIGRGELMNMPNGKSSMNKQGLVFHNLQIVTVNDAIKSRHQIFDERGTFLGVGWLHTPYDTV